MFSDYKAMEAQFQKEGGQTLNGEITGNEGENQNGTNQAQERRDKRGNEIKKGV